MLYQWLERETRIIDRPMRILKERHAYRSLPCSKDCLKSRDEHKQTKPSIVSPIMQFPLDDQGASEMDLTVVIQL